MKVVEITLSVFIPEEGEPQLKPVMEISGLDKKFTYAKFKKFMSLLEKEYEQRNQTPYFSFNQN